MIEQRESSRRGGPLAVIGIVLAVWIAGRTLLWESPFPANSFALPDEAALIAENSADVPKDPDRERNRDRLPAAGVASSFGGAPTFSQVLASGLGGQISNDAFIRMQGGFSGTAAQVLGEKPHIASGHQMLWSAALGKRSINRSASYMPSSDTALQSPFVRPPFTPEAVRKRVDRWTLDLWAFGRQGSNSAAISQGRAPIYGASQIGAVLRYRLDGNSRRAPDLYARAYRALVSGGESELAFGVSARPIASVPIRAQAELRVTENVLGTEVRPAAFLVTALAPQNLAAEVTAEAYAQAGYVGGDAATAFADGQLTLTREVAEFSLPATRTARLSVGAGAWGGAQKDASRVDLGPTMRLDLSIGTVPARFSVDWREQVAGDAAPSSGVAATLSTRF